ncbi:nose resistant to fluoxetine protein 6-like isoform X2 [Zerene cesonia]|uniref:nose resistant to fluoxetine protein 6-like isoform X2 n=1 Tax=Zerene cesonia TaxID=33412 RepID=UPI0018E57D6D|nr:nose resistant to fluoxetine protein 6-like isoform X2 [Zerene cesonia]
MSLLPTNSRFISRSNDTLLSTIPPLYDLDEWTSCQRPMDRYCMVDAALVSKTPSPLLDLLKDYSSQTLKHYNRSQVHRGVCVSRCHSNASNWQDAAQHCVNQSVQSYGLEAEVVSAEWCSVAGSDQSSATSRALGVVMIALLVMTCLATGLNVLGDRCGKCDGNRFLMAFSLKKNWEILTYDRSKPRQEQRMKDLTCLEGIRFIGMQCVMFAHVILIYVYSYIDNPEFIEKIYDQLIWKIVLNSPVWLQAFFSISGFLTAYVILIVTEKKPLTFVKCLLGILNRWIRLTPIALFALVFTIAWYPQLGAGPQWAWVVQREAHDCASRWWHHVLYVHNHLPLGKFCMGHTWYLAVDMQFHVLGMLLMFVLVRYRRAVAPVLLLLMLGSMVAAGCVTYFYELSPIVTAQSPEDLRTMFLDSRILPLLYLPSWMNLPGYVCGVATAFIFYHTQQAGINLSEKKWFRTLFHLSLHAGSVVALCGTVFLSDFASTSAASEAGGAGTARVFGAIYAALDRPLVAMCYSVFMLGLFARCPSGVLKLLSWRGFHVLGRLSYCAFVIHFIIIRFAVASNTQLGHASIFSMLSLLIVGSVVTYIVCIPVCLIIELPVIQLWKAVTEAPAEQVDPPANPKFDLVASISRRNV